MFGVCQAYNCKLFVHEETTSWRTPKHPEAFCGSAVLHREEGGDKQTFTARLVMMPDRFAMVRTMLAVPDLCPKVLLEFTKPLEGWKDERARYCDRFAVEF